MKILAISDCPPKNSIKKILDYADIDMICTLGDLDLFGLAELEFINHVPKIGVYGDHCSGTYFEKLGIKNIHLKTFKYKGLTFGGFEGSLKYDDSSYAKFYTQEESRRFLEKFPRVDVMISHSPPYGVNDNTMDPAYTGFEGLCNYLDDKSPRYLIHGHTRPPEEILVKKWKETEIIYIHGDRSIVI